MDEAKISAIVAMPKRENPKQVQSFMGHCGYYQRFIFQYAYIARPLYSLLVAFTWTKECDIAFEKMRSALIFAPIL